MVCGRLPGLPSLHVVRALVCELERSSQAVPRVAEQYAALFDLEVGQRYVLPHRERQLGNLARLETGGRMRDDEAAVAPPPTAS